MAKALLGHISSHPTPAPSTVWPPRTVGCASASPTSRRYVMRLQAENDSLAASLSAEACPTVPDHQMQPA